LDEEKIGLIEKETYGNLKKERRREETDTKKKISPKINYVNCSLYL
jgi:hypothetical protein